MLFVGCRWLLLVVCCSVFDCLLFVVYRILFVCRALLVVCVIRSMCVARCSLSLFVVFVQRALFVFVMLAATCVLFSDSR